MGALGAFVSAYTATQLADDLDTDLNQIYRWVRGDASPCVTRAIQVVEIARGVGTELSLEDVFAAQVTRVRCRMRASLPPL